MPVPISLAQYIVEPDEDTESDQKHRLSLQHLSARVGTGGGAHNGMSGVRAWQSLIIVTVTFI